MSNDIEQLPYEQRMKYLVFGFVRRIQKSTTLNIPIEIIYICVDLFFIKESFSKCDQSTIHINSQSDIATCQHDITVCLCTTIRGEVIINDNPSYEYKWTFQILNKNDSTTGFIGIIDSTTKSFINVLFHTWRSKIKFYGTSFEGILEGHEYGGPHADCNHLQAYFKNGDIIEMSVNTLHKTISYRVNNQDLGIAWDSIEFDNMSYRMAIGLQKKHDSIKLLSFDLTSTFN
eukprot:118834_1